MSLFLAVLSVFTPVTYADTPPQPNATVEAAAGRGEYTTDQRLVARLNICYVALKEGIAPSQLTAALTANKFSPEAKQETLDVCSAFATGIELGKTLNPKETA